MPRFLGSLISSMSDHGLETQTAQSLPSIWQWNGNVSHSWTATFVSGTADRL